MTAEVRGWTPIDRTCPACHARADQPCCGDPAASDCSMIEGFHDVRHGGRGDPRRNLACSGDHPAPACRDERCYIVRPEIWKRGESSLVTVEAFRRIQAELRRSQERELAIVGERTRLVARLERQATWLSWPQYGEIGAAAALRRALLEACGIGLSWTSGDTVDGRRLRALHDLAVQSNGALAREESKRDETAPRISPEAAPRSAAANLGGDGMKHRVITDPVLCITLTLGVNGGLARISWSDGSCHVNEAALCLGRWTLAKFQDHPEQTPPAAVVCCATALAVGAWINESIGLLRDEVAKPAAEIKS